jgi:glycosyltransferase involved in cell wall biosynthesis
MPRVSHPVVSVIVPALNAAATIDETLAGLAEQDLDAPFEVIVVDNGSDDGTAGVVAERLPSARVLTKERDRAGTARNLGAGEAEAPVLAFTDADCRPTPGWLRAGLRGMESADLVQGAVAADPGSSRGPFDRTVWVSDDHGLYETASLFVGRAAFESVGGFEDWASETDLRVPFGEDTWLGWRLRRAGARVAFSPDALVHHAVFPRGPREYAAERRRAEHFPALVARIPELRRAFLTGGVFLTPRTAVFDLGVASAIAALIASSPWPALGLLPYGADLARSAAPWRRRAPSVAVGELAADATTLLALLRGSVRHRTLVI